MPGDFPGDVRRRNSWLLAGIGGRLSWLLGSGSAGNFKKKNWLEMRVFESLSGSTGGERCAALRQHLESGGLAELRSGWLCGMLAQAGYWSLLHVMESWLRLAGLFPSMVGVVVIVAAVGVVVAVATAISVLQQVPDDVAGLSLSDSF